MARMSIDDKLLRDPRAIKLGRIYGWRRQEAVGRLMDVFTLAYDRERDVIPADDIDIAAEQEGFAERMIEVDLAERVRGGVRIKGASKRIQYLQGREETGRQGGLKSAETRRKKAELRSKVTFDFGEGRLNPPDPVPDDPPDPVPEIPDQSLSHAGARAQPAPPPPTHTHTPAPVPARPRVDRPPSVEGYDDQDPRTRGQLAEATYRRVSDARLAIAAELKLPAPLPFPPIGPSSRAGSFRELLDRVREEGAAAPLVCDRVVSNLIAQAREERAIEWLAEKAFSAGPWRTAREWMPGAAARRRGPARGDPIPHATPPRRPDPPLPPPVSEADRAAAAAVLAEARARMFGTPPIDDDTDDTRRPEL